MSLEFKQAIKQVPKKSVRARRKYVCQSEQDAYIALWRSSELDAELFCCEHNLNCESFSRWLKYRKIDIKSPHEIAINQDEKQAQPQPFPDATVKCIELSFPNGGSLSIKGDFGSELVMTLLKESALCK